MDSFNTQQQTIVDQVLKLKISHDTVSYPKKYTWNKYNGDATAKIFMHYLSPYLPAHLVAIGPNVFIQDLPIEFDILIVNRAYTPANFPYNYPASEVKAIIESKLNGIYGGNQKIPQVLGDINTNFQSAIQLNRNITCIYLTLREVASTKSPTAINYFQRTKDALDQYHVFCLRDNHTRAIILGMWEAFIRVIQNLH